MAEEKAAPSMDVPSLAKWFENRGRLLRNQESLLAAGLFSCLERICSQESITILEPTNASYLMRGHKGSLKHLAIMKTGKVVILEKGLSDPATELAGQILGILLNHHDGRRSLRWSRQILERRFAQALVFSALGLNPEASIRAYLSQACWNTEPGEGTRLIGIDQKARVWGEVSTQATPAALALLEMVKNLNMKPAAKAA